MSPDRPQHPADRSDRCPGAPGDGGGSDDFPLPAGNDGASRAGNPSGRPPRAVVIGPQPGRIHLGAALEALDPPPGPVAAITVGWRETEPVEREVDRELERSGREPAPLLIGERVGRIFERDPELAEAHRALQEGLLAEEKLYSARLGQALEASRAVARLAVRERYRAPYAEEAWKAVLAADRFHLDNHTRMWGEFRRRLRLAERPVLRAERDELERILGDAAAVVLTGGHVAVIRNRLLLLDLGAALSRRPILAWSAGAMTLTPRIVVFHDRLPHGSAPPQILGEGLSLLPGVAFFPDARRRLDLDNRESLGELAARVAPERAVLLDPDDLLCRDGETWTAAAGIRTLAPDGEIESLPRLPPTPAETSPEAGPA